MPCRAVVVGGIRHDDARVVELAVRQRVFRDGEEKPSVLELYHAVVVEDVVGNFVRYARRRLAPRPSLVKRAAHHGTAVRKRVLEQVEQRNLPALESEKADAHHVHPALVPHDYLVFAEPRCAVVAGIARGDVGCGMVRLGLPAVARVREHDASVAKRKERAFAVARIAGAGRKVERPPNAWRGARQDLQHDLADRARRAVGQSGSMAAIRREERGEFARRNRETLALGAPEDDVPSRIK